MNYKERTDVKVAVLEYFPGANTPKGFYSYYDYILKSREANKIIVLKGGPGTGKSTFMKRIAGHLNSLGYDTELLHCSSDPNSLDGVCAREIGFLILDGTAPHIVDPKCPGAVDEIINLGECWDKEKICKHKLEIIETNERISMYFARSYRYLSAAKCLQPQELCGFDENEMAYELEKLKKELDLNDTGKREGHERKAFLSAITPLGKISYINTFIENSKCIYKIKSGCPEAAGQFMRKLADMLMANGCNIRTFYCPMSPNEKIEHIYADGILFSVKNDYNKLENANAVRDVNLDNYLDFKDIQCNLTEDREQYNLLLNQAEKMVRRAKSLHDKLEEYYVPYMDFAKVESLCNGVIKSII